MGNSNNNQYSRVQAGRNAKADGKKSGYNVDPGPYEAIVQGHVEGTRMGQLIVTIPDWSGIVDGSTDGVGNESDQIVVSYASPFYGTTFGTGTQQLPDSDVSSGQSYGMWMVPPDVGCKVLVTFVAGDMSRGYWFACVYDSPSHHMVPGMARNVGGDTNVQVSDSVAGYVAGDSIVPVIEYNTKDSNSFNSDGLTTTKRFAHNYQSMKLVQQGLDRDKIRGAISSSSLRESPSNVYGISTPGRKLGKADQNPKNPQAVYARQGGHQFVMDDGDKDGNDQLIRLRTTGGHQILMNDTENILYIASASGAQWLEFSPNGSINIYGAAGLNLRTEGPMNFHSDAAINMCAPVFKVDAVPSSKGLSLPSISLNSAGTFKASGVMSASLSSDITASVNAIGKVSISAGAALNVSAVGAVSVSSAASTNISATAAVNIDAGGMLMLNCAAPKPPLPPIPTLPPITKGINDTVFNGKAWDNNGVLQTTVKVAPAHEPWERPPKKTK